MKAVPIVEPTRIIGPPSNWDENASGECGHLAVRDVEILGTQFMLSVWKPEADDLAVLNAGGVITLYVQGTTHPVVAMGTGPKEMNQIPDA